VLCATSSPDYSERSLTSALPPIGDPESVVRDVLDRVTG
jgi:pilus assembly protein CpaF